MNRTYIESRRNPLLVHLHKLLTSRSYREKCGQFAAEGTKLLEEAAKWYPALDTVVVQQGVELCPLPAHVRVAEVPEALMRAISQQDAPQGAAFICALPQPREACVQAGSILLDGIQDPGNLGTILRTADALSVPVVLLDGCADAYSPKTVRASMGAVLRTQPQRMTREQALESCRAQGIPLLATAMTARARDLRQAALAEAAVVIGSEGQGVSSLLLEAADESVVIPMASRCESLNAAIAAAIVMWQMKQ